MSYLEQNFQPIQWGSACSGNSTSHSTSHQVAPPYARLKLCLCEIIWHQAVLTNINDLETKHSNLHTRKKKQKHTETNTGERERGGRELLRVAKSYWGEKKNMTRPDKSWYNNNNDDINKAYYVPLLKWDPSFYWNVSVSAQCQRRHPWSWGLQTSQLLSISRSAALDNQHFPH